jgi:type II secretory pathway pseudopilin PulG
MRARRRGLGLAEVLVGVALLGVIGALAARLVSGATRAAVRVRERSARSATLRTAALAVTREVQELAAGEVRVAGDTLRYRARRGEGVACAVSGTRVSVARASYRGWREPQPGRDSLALLDRDTGAWTIAAVAAVAAGACPDGTPSLELTGLVPWTGPAPAPVRLLEWVELRAYESGGAWWLGARTLRPTDVIQPLAGPVAVRGTGFSRLAVGAADTVLEVRLRVPRARVAGGSLPADSTVLRLPLARGGAP